MNSKITNGRITKRKLRASLSKCLVQIRGVKFHTHPNGKCLQRSSNYLNRTQNLNCFYAKFCVHVFTASDSTNHKLPSSSDPVKRFEHPTRIRAKYG